MFAVSPPPFALPFLFPFIMNSSYCFKNLKGGQNGAITHNFYFQFYFNGLDLNIEPKLNIKNMFDQNLD